jgi:hypothetical protein
VVGDAEIEIEIRHLIWREGKKQWSETWLSEDGCSPQEIATYTGWSLRDVQTILDRYLARTDKLRSTALEKLERARR